MTAKIKLSTDNNIIPFDFGVFVLNFERSDEKSEFLTHKSEELKEKAEKVNENGTEWEIRKELKELLDEFFGSMFDTDAPAKIYEACGKNTISYLKAFLQVANEMQKIQTKEQNDEDFLKYLAE
ncbi:MULTISPECIES: hypothetical protein [Streptococcus]|uniref:Phage protein n=1 Tax=Streptococcus caledonicus TaxID=2614158 RepID=A0ABW0UBL9_9STRE|nr:hypothetical protein [Streptococcus sp. S784/96/1]